MQVMKTMVTETAHRLVDYPGNCQHLHGHSYYWEVGVSSHTLDDLGMVVDFKTLKELMKKHIFKYDHALILNTNDPLIGKVGVNELRKLLINTTGEEPRLFLYPFNPTAENLAKLVYENIVYDPSFVAMTMDVKLDYVRVRETESSYATYSGE